MNFLNSLFSDFQNRDITGLLSCVCRKLYMTFIGMTIVYGGADGLVKWVDWIFVRDRVEFKENFRFLESYANVLRDVVVLTYFTSLGMFSGAVVGLTAPISIPCLMHFSEKKRG